MGKKQLVIATENKLNFQTNIDCLQFFTVNCCVLLHTRFILSFNTVLFLKVRNALTNCREVTLGKVHNNWIKNA